MSMPGPMELIIIFLVILLLFGAKRIPEILRSFGEGMREFKKGMSSMTDPEPKQGPKLEPKKEEKPEDQK